MYLRLAQVVVVVVADPRAVLVPSRRVASPRTTAAATKNILRPATTLRPTLCRIGPYASSPATAGDRDAPILALCQESCSEPRIDRDWCAAGMETSQLNPMERWNGQLRGCAGAYSDLFFPTVRTVSKLGGSVIDVISSGVSGVLILKETIALGRTDGTTGRTRRPTRQDGTVGFDPLADDLRAETRRAPSERGQVRAPEGSGGHVGVFRMVA